MADAGCRMKNPVHPGGRREIVEPLELTVTSAAGVLDVSRQGLSTLWNEGGTFSSDMALRIGKAFGVSMDTRMRMQNSFDIAEARSREDEIKVDRYVPKAKGSAEPRLA
jgi:antitoxin HigA-1